MIGTGSGEISTGRVMRVPSGRPLHVTLVATPDSQVSPLSGLYETFNAFGPVEL
jgi:hypothetical protein